MFPIAITDIIAEYADYAIYPRITTHFPIDWRWLSANPAAMPLLLANQDKINWNHLSANPAAMPLLLANQDKINWEFLSENSAAMPMILANLDKINYRWIYSNPAIFIADPAIAAELAALRRE